MTGSNFPFDQDAFGNTIQPRSWQNGLWHPTSGWGHNSNEHSTDVGLTYMYQRWYLPETGTFVSMAPFSSDLEHPFGFALQNPIHGLDPQGTFSFRDAISLPIRGGILIAGLPIRAIDKLRKQTEICAARAFTKNYRDMRKANTIGADKYFHCKANCEASKCGGTGMALAIDVTREASDIMRNNRNGIGIVTSHKDSASDMAANLSGLFPPPGCNDDCKSRCSGRRPNGLPANY